MNNYVLRLYVTGMTSRSRTAIANLKDICEDALAGRYDLEIVDVLESPEMAETDKVMATPTLIKNLPPPVRRIIGDLSDRARVLAGLELIPAPDSDAAPGGDQ